MFFKIWTKLNTFMTYTDRWYTDIRSSFYLFQLPNSLSCVLFRRVKPTKSTSSLYFRRSTISISASANLMLGDLSQRSAIGYMEHHGGASNKYGIYPKEGNGFLSLYMYAQPSTTSLITISKENCMAKVFNKNNIILIKHTHLLDFQTKCINNIPNLDLLYQG